MKNRKVLILTILLVISLIGNVVLLVKLNGINNKSNPDVIESFDNVPNELVGTWEAKAGRKVEIFEDGKVYWTYNASGSIYTGYIGTVNDYSIVLSKKYEGNGKGNYQSMLEISEAELQDTYIIYDITMHGDTAFSAQNVDSREYAWSFIKSE